MEDNEIYAETQRRIRECRGKGLEKLDFSSLSITKNPPEIADLGTLTELDITGYEMKKIPGFIGIPKWVFVLENLEALSIYDNAAQTIPADIAKMKNLRKLRVYGENITSLPHEIGEQLGLTVLDLQCPLWQSCRP